MRGESLLGVLESNLGLRQLRVSQALAIINRSIHQNTEKQHQSIRLKALEDMISGLDYEMLLVQDNILQE